MLHTSLILHQVVTVVIQLYFSRNAHLIIYSEGQAGSCQPIRFYSFLLRKPPFHHSNQNFPSHELLVQAPTWTVVVQAPLLRGWVVTEKLNNKHTTRTEQALTLRTSGHTYRLLTQHAARPAD